MSDRSGIEWTQATWNPMLGCTKVSPGCDHCYAIRTVHRLAANPNPNVSTATAGLTARDSVGRLDWTGRVNLLPERLAILLRWREPRRIFVNSQSDLFHDDVPDEFIARVWAVMAATPQHTFQILTKRHGRMRSLVSSPGFQRAASEAATDLLDTGAVRSLPTGLGKGAAVVTSPRNRWEPEWPVPGVWLGVSVEDQKRADLRIPALLDTPAAVRFVSCEPLLGAVDLGGRGWLPVSLNDPDPDAECHVCGTEEFSDQGGHVVVHRCGSRLSEPCQELPNGDCALDGTSTGEWCDGPIKAYPRIDWVICGGESGPGARPAHPDWFRQLRDQCAAAGVAFFHKQNGEWREPRPGEEYNTRYGRAGHPPAFLIDHDGNVYCSREAAGDSAVPVVRVGKKAAGRELDGRTWDEYP